MKSNYIVSEVKMKSWIVYRRREYTTLNMEIVADPLQSNKITQDFWDFNHNRNRSICNCGGCPFLFFNTGNYSNLGHNWLYDIRDFLCGDSDPHTGRRTGSWFFPFRMECIWFHYSGRQHNTHCGYASGMGGETCQNLSRAALDCIRATTSDHNRYVDGSYPKDWVCCPADVYFPEVAVSPVAGCRGGECCGDVRHEVYPGAIRPSAVDVLPGTYRYVDLRPAPVPVKNRIDTKRGVRITKPDLRVV